MNARNFVSVLAHFITESLLQSRIVIIQQFVEEKKSGANIRQIRKKNFMYFGFDMEKFSKDFVYV